MPRVFAYCRVSTDSEEQASSYEIQIEHYTKYIKKNKEWELAGIFAMVRDMTCPFPKDVRPRNIVLTSISINCDTLLFVLNLHSLHFSFTVFTLSFVLAFYRVDKNQYH